MEVGGGERTSLQTSSAGPQLPGPSRPRPGSGFRRGAAARACTPKAPARLEPGATRPSAPRPPPRSALPEHAIRVPRVPTRRAQPVSLAEELLEQSRSHAGHSQAGVSPQGAY